MSEKKRKTNWVSFVLPIAVLAVMLLFGWQSGVRLWQWCLLIVAVGLLGFTFGAKYAFAIEETNAKNAYPAHELPENTVYQPTAGPEEHHENAYLNGILDELSLMQNSDDILERYRGFIRVIESSMRRSLGDCGISLWCPDHEYETLIECVIHPTQGNQDRINSKWIKKEGQWRMPCVVPLDSPIIRESLKSGRAYCAGITDSESLMAGRAAEATLSCDACIPLYRNYGQPLLIQVERAGSQLHLCKPEEFHRMVKLIRFFWKQIQATNQRQWLVEHDGPTGALREETFLAQGQAWSDGFAHRDELFSIVVITVRGYRSMFTGESARWRQLNSVLGNSLRKILARQFGKFLLGKMADDVFTLMLPGMDRFLCETSMRPILQSLEQELTQVQAENLPEISAVEMQWCVADHTQYNEDLEELLNDMYCCLFSRSESTKLFKQKITIRETENKTETALCK